MPASEPDILSALRVLTDAPREILQTHRDLALHILEQIRNVLLTDSYGEARVVTNLTCAKFGQQNSNLRASSGCIHPQRSADSESSSAPSNHDASVEDCNFHDNSNSHDPQSSDVIEFGHFNAVSPAPPFVIREPTYPRKRKRDSPKPNRPARVFQAVQKHIRDLVQFSKSKPSLHMMLRNEQNVNRVDLRVDHIKRVDGNKTPSFQEQLLKGLCQISLARQFTAWELERGWPSRVEELRSHLSESPRQSNRRKRGKVSQYIRNTGFPVSDHGAINKAICRGTVQLLFKFLIEEAVGSSGQQSLVEGLFSGVTIFEPFLFQSLKINELPQIIDLLLESENDLGTPSTEEVSSGRLLSSLKAVNAWSESIQSDFETICIKQHCKTPSASFQIPRLTISSREESLSHLHSVGSTEIGIAPFGGLLQTTEADTIYLSEIQPLNNAQQESDCVQPSPNDLDLASHPQHLFHATAEPNTSLFVQPAKFPFPEAMPHPDTFSVLDPSSHVVGIDSSFPYMTNNVNAVIGENGCGQFPQFLPSLDPSSHVQNVNFTMFNPAEHVQPCSFEPLAESNLNPLPVAGSISSRAHSTAES